MKHSFDEAGNLVISVDKKEQRELERRMKTEEYFHSDDTMSEILEPLICNSELSFCSPEDIGALTSAPILCTRNEKNEIEDAWGFMSYQLRSVQQDLAEDGSAFFQKG